MSPSLARVSRRRVFFLISLMSVRTSVGVSAGIVARRTDAYRRHVYRPFIEIDI